MNYKVVVISLIRRQDRRDKITKQFNEHGIPFEFYDAIDGKTLKICLLYTSPSPRDRQKSRMPSSA